MNTSQQTTKKRNVALDLLRVIAILLVIWQHTSEFYYIGDNLQLVDHDLTRSVGILDSLSRLSVPLFVMISGYLLLPLKGTVSHFFKHRFTRILWPWLFWCVAFAVYFVFYRDDSLTTCLLNIARIPVNWGVDVGHLWYIYMLIGLYLLVPILSPWLNQCSKRQLQFYLSLWLITTLLPYLHLWQSQWWGECTWNPTPTLYYFTGFGGYLVLGYYLKRYGAFSVPVSVLMIVVGYAVSAGAFIGRIPVATDVVDLETAWNFCSLNVAMMAAGLFSLIIRLKFNPDTLWSRLIRDIAVCSYAMYLSHIMVLNAFHDLFGGQFGTVWVEIPLIALCTFAVTYVLMKLLALLPGARYWLGIDNNRHNKTTA